VRRRAAPWLALLGRLPAAGARTHAPARLPARLARAPRSPVPLKVVASSLDSLRSEVLADFTCPADLQESLKASALVPEIAGPPRLHRGHR
jgi:hypothetical protein